MKACKNFFKALGLILEYIGISLLLQIGYLLLGIENVAITVGALIFMSAFATGFVVYKMRDGLKGQFADFKKNARKYLLKAFDNWIVGFVIMIVVNGALINLLGGIAPNEEANREMMNVYLLYSLVYSCILAPVAEELLFRMNFKGVFKSKKVFIWVTASLFGLLHILGNVEVWTDVLYVFPYMVLGYYFSKTYVETGNIYASISAHMFHNILAMIVTLGQL